ncbi:hypothetical protein J7T55_014684 [Diaporthe amygdali]|uniref:uncharacterized protein n=1 Tax=Phomopsis amygdali TaxID=1214568 RepID=UPI0022FEFD6B|nr:uncharacterized protein J7T55_014684 [Diaporthe amygdali]KAJ0107154.1 hypothetical protein J7T55_014684 [Diaporthe amygdali]
MFPRPLLTVLALILTSLASASDIELNPEDRLVARGSPPKYVENKILWSNDDDGDKEFCKSHEPPQINEDDPDCDLSPTDCLFLSLGFWTGFLHPRGTWFQVYRERPQSTSNLTQVASYRSCAVSVALLNGPSASVSILDIMSKFSQNSSELRSSYGQIWCPVLPDIGSASRMGVAWLIGCPKAGAPVTILSGLTSG